VIYDNGCKVWHYINRRKPTMLGTWRIYNDRLSLRLEAEPFTSLLKSLPAWTSTQLLKGKSHMLCRGGFVGYFLPEHKRCLRQAHLSTIIHCIIYRLFAPRCAFMPMCRNEQPLPPSNSMLSLGGSLRNSFLFLAGQRTHGSVSLSSALVEQAASREPCLDAPTRGPSKGGSISSFSRLSATVRMMMLSSEGQLLI